MSGTLMTHRTQLRLLSLMIQIITDQLVPLAHSVDLSLMVINKISHLNIVLRVHKCQYVFLFFHFECNIL